AVGSSANCADPMTVLNTVVAEQLVDFKTKVDADIKKGEKRDSAILKALRQCIKASRSILFEGDNYSDDWANEAKKRGLSNIKSTPKALDAYVTKESKALFERAGILNERELEARHEIRLENYTLKVQIESRLIEELALNQIIPSAIRYQTEVLTNITQSKAAGMPAASHTTSLELAKSLSEHISAVKQGVLAMREARTKAENQKTTRAEAIAFCDNVKPQFETIRHHVDELELLVDDGYWPLPKYREILFTR
ncbi:MAG: glutamine synthetase type III, partial [Saprospiraceae bacterium]|nr:glutamine synthetase type III [Saprospiraceae bacterium]